MYQEAGNSSCVAYSDIGIFHFPSVREGFLEKGDFSLCASEGDTLLEHQN